MSKITIRTNNVPRWTIDHWDLTEKEAKEFDYLEPDEGLFFRYKGNVYDLGEFFRITPPGSKRNHPTECQEPAFQGWDGYQSDSFFHGLLVKFVDNDTDKIIVGEYFC